MINTGSNGFENNDQQAENAESKTADQQNENTVGAEQTENKPVKGIVKSVEDKKVTIVIGEKTYTFENNKDDLKLQKGDKVSVVLVKDAEGKEQVKSVKVLPADTEIDKTTLETAAKAETATTETAAAETAAAETAATTETAAAETAATTETAAALEQ